MVLFAAAWNFYWIYVTTQLLQHTCLAAPVATINAKGKLYGMDGSKREIRVLYEVNEKILCKSISDSKLEQRVNRKKPGKSEEWKKIFGKVLNCIMTFRSK